MTQQDRLLRTIKWSAIVGGGFAVASVYFVLDYAALNFLTTSFTPDTFVRTFLLMTIPAMSGFLLGHFAERKYFQLEVQGN